MKFTAFVLATAAASAVAQTVPQQQVPGQAVQNGFNGFVQNPFFSQQGYAIQQPYQIQYPQQQPVYQVQQVVDPLAWERDCTWINSVNFRAFLSRATCGADTCQTNSPNGNGGGHKRQTVTTGTTTTTTGYHVWGSVINRAGRVCAVAYTGGDLTRQFPYGRILSMKLANTANSLSLPTRAMPSHVRHYYPNNNRGLIMNGASNPQYASGNPNSIFNNGDSELLEHPLRQGGAGARPQDATQIRDAAGRVVAQTSDDWSRVLATIQLATNGTPLGGAAVPFNAGLAWEAESMWFGFTLPAEQYNPGNVDVHYQGATSNYGEACGTTRQDPMCMQKPGGFAYQAGGLALYDNQGVIRGALGVAGDNDCTDHAIAWKTRQQLGLEYVPGNEIADERNDKISAANVGPATTATSTLALALASTEEVHWAGKNAEDNAIFDQKEQYLFPQCQSIIQKFATSNPTKNSVMNAGKNKN